MAAVCAAHAQTYQIGPETPNQNAKPGQKQAPKQAQGQQPELGFGSNIENARLGRAAEQALQRGDKVRALEFAQRAAQAAPNDAQLWFLVGYAARLNGRYGQSSDAYSHGLRINPSSLEGLSGLAQTYAAMGKNEEAQKLLKQVLAANPKRANDALVLGDIYMRGGDYASAVDALGQAERAHPDARSELLLAISYEHLNKPDMATRYLEAARKRAPDNPEVQRAMAGYYRQEGKYPEAIAALKSIKNPRPDVVAELAYTYQLDGKLDESAKTYAKAANSVPKDLNLQLSAAQAQVAAGSTEEADAFLKRAAGIDGNNYRLHAIRGEIARIHDQGPEAINEYKIAIAHLPAEPVEGPLYGIQLHMNLSDLYKAQRDDQNSQSEVATAKQQVEKLDEQGPNRPQLLRLRAQIKLASGDPNGALADVRNALAIDSRNPGGLQLNGDVLMKLGRTEEAITTYKKILAIDAKNRFALISLGYASRAAGRDDDAEKYFQRLTQVEPNLSVGYAALGDLYTARKHYSKAETAYAKAFELAPKNAMVVAGAMNAAIEAHDLDLAGKWLARSTPEMAAEPQFLREEERYLSFKGDYEQSAKIGQQAIKVLPKDRDVVVYLGYDMLHMERYDELFALTQQYMDVLPKEPDIPLLQGYVHKHQNKSEEAEQDFTETLKRDPDMVTAYVNRGYMRNDLHNPEGASADFDAALKRDPKNGEANLGMAYADLNLHRSQAAIRHADIAEKLMGDSKNVHVIRATAYGREGMLTKAATEYKAALKFTPDDPALHLGLAGTLFGARRYHDAIDELQVAEKYGPDNPAIPAMLARSYAFLGEREQTFHYVEIAEKVALAAPPPSNPYAESIQSDTFVSTGQALAELGDQNAAMDRYRKALEMPQANRVSVRLAIAQTMAQQDRNDDAQREIALAMMEAAAGDSLPPTGQQYIQAADIFRSLHDYQLSETYIGHAKIAGAPETSVRIGLANTYLALGETTKANAELAAIKTDADSAPDYQYLLAQANLYRQEHRNVEALSSFAQASNIGGEDESASTSLLQAGANEGLRVTPQVSVLSDFTVAPIFEDTTTYVLDSKLDASFVVPSTDPSLLPPPRSQLQMQSTNAFHLHLGKLPEPGGFFQIRNSRGQISVPATNSIANRNTTDWTLNFALNPSVNLGRNIITFSGGVQTTIRRDSLSPREINQNLFRTFIYMQTSSFFNALSASGYLIRESGPFTNTDEHSRVLAAALNFRVGAPWGKTALVTGWGGGDQVFHPAEIEDYLTSSYIGLEHRFSERLSVRGMVEDLRAWRVVHGRSGIAQDLRPAASVDFKPRRNWEIQARSAFSSTRSFHVYDASQNGFSVSYARPFKRKFRDESGEVVLQYPIRISGGVQTETFFNFPGGHSQQIRPYIQVSIF
ncbi:MAG: tetratricopeptide repeat protein [Acidobacteria bacterium]|nr:tetratricopeptide repeat protein [Acidobacteriota bacterium]